jgi:hypothetical protein
LAVCIAIFSLLCLKKRSVTIEVLIFHALVGIMLIGEGFSTIRGQLYSLTFVACLLWFFELDQNGNRRWITAWILLYVIWVNIHAGFLVGIGLIGAYWLEQLLRRKPNTHLILAGAAMLGLIAINPYGLDYYPYLWRAMTMPRPYIKEWYPIWSGLDPSHLSFYTLSLILLVYSVKEIGIRNAHGIALIITVGLGSIFCNRLVFFYAIVWTCYVPGYLQITPLGNVMHNVCKKFSKFLILLLCVAIVASFVRTLSFRPWKLFVPSDHIRKYGDHAIYPVGPVEYLKQVGFKGNLMVFFDWGSYVTWKLYPDVRVSMDSRYEAAYPGWLVDENIEFYRAKEGWQRTLNQYPTDLVLVSKYLPLVKVIPQESAWKKIYRDNVFELYARPGLKLPVVDWTGLFFTGTFP